MIPTIYPWWCWSYFPQVCTFNLHFYLRFFRFCLSLVWLHSLKSTPNLKHHHPHVLRSPFQFVILWLSPDSFTTSHFVFYFPYGFCILNPLLQLHNIEPDVVQQFVSPIQVLDSDFRMINHDHKRI